MIFTSPGTIDGLFAKELMKNCKAIVSDSKSCSVTDVLVTSVAETGSVGKSTVLLAHLDGQVSFWLLHLLD